jgi:hypothetical protein
VRCAQVAAAAINLLFDPAAPIAAVFVAIIPMLTAHVAAILTTKE